VRTKVLAVLLLVSSATFAAPRLDDIPLTPATFMPEGLLGVQIGRSFEESKKSKALEELSCEPVEPKTSDADEVCFFKTSATSRVAGVAIHDGFMVRKDDKLVLIATGISIKNADDPLAESVVRSFEHDVHAAFQQMGNEVLFVKMPAHHMSPEELNGFSKTAPVLLVQLQRKSSELAVMYGYLAPVNLFSTITAD
jgi:hypothetical protein